MASAWYELGKDLQTRVHLYGQGTKGPASGATPHRNSWLNRQRQRVVATPQRKPARAPAGS